MNGIAGKMIGETGGTGAPHLQPGTAGTRLTGTAWKAPARTGTSRGTGNGDDLMMPRCRQTAELGSELPGGKLRCTDAFQATAKFCIE